jgi:hypothetical protein
MLYLAFHLTDELIVRGRDVMWGVTYKRHEKQNSVETGDQVGARTGDQARADANTRDTK